jgi:hypothetical protein
MNGGQESAVETGDEDIDYGIIIASCGRIDESLRLREPVWPSMARRPRKKPREGLF